MRLSLASFTLVAALAIAATTVAAAAPIRDCKGAQLKGSFALVPGSPAAGSVSYRLVLKNVSRSACAITGLPQLQLLGKKGNKLPTHVRAAFPGALTAIFVRLQPGQRTRATARFSPDVPGVGEQGVGRCEPIAYTARVTAPGGGTTTVKLLPPTPVCEKGRLFFSAYGR